MSSSRSWSHVSTPAPGVGGSTLLGLVGLVAMGCSGGDKGTATLDAVDGWSPERVEVVSTVRAGEVVLRARTVNAFRVAVPAGELTVQATGNHLDAGGTTQVLDPSATGVASLRLPVTGPGRTELTVTASADNLDLNAASGEAWTVGLPMSQWAAGSLSQIGAPELEPTFSAAGTGGVAVALEDEVWWHSDVPGEPPHVVADMPQNVAGLTSGHLDRDGVLDLAVWSGNQVVVLRGLAEGGYTWGGAWRAVDGNAVGASISDANGDRIADLSIGTSGGGSGAITVFAHDGAWGFEPYPELIVNTELYSIAVADETGDGAPDVSIFATVTGTVRRYTLAEEGWVGSPTSELPNFESADGGTLLPLADLDGDGVLETVISGSPDANTQDLVFYVIDPAGAGSVNYPQSYGVYDATIADLDLDGNPEIVLAEDDTLNVIGWDGETFESRSSAGIGPHGPIAVGEYSGDGLPDAAIATDLVRFHPGGLSEAGDWVRERYSWTSYPTLYNPNATLADVNRDGAVDLVGLQVDPDTGDVDVVAWSLDFSGVEPQIDPLGTVNLVTSGVGHDLAVCEGEVYALSEGIDDDTGTTTSVTRLSLIRFNASTGAELVSERTLDRGVMLDCGIVDNGNFGVVVSSQTGFWSSFARELGAVSEGDVGATEDIALADTDGDGLGEVIGCTGGDVACTVVALDVDGDGLDEVVRSHSVTTLSSTTGDVELAGRGELSVADIDGDGRTDVLGWDADAGALLIWRNVDATLAPPAGLHSDRPLVSLAGLGDMTGDGVPELVFIDENGAVTHSSTTVATEGATW